MKGVPMKGSLGGKSGGRASKGREDKEEAGGRRTKLKGLVK